MLGYDFNLVRYNFLHKGGFEGVSSTPRNPGGGGIYPNMIRVNDKLGLVVMHLCKYVQNMLIIYIRLEKGSGSVCEAKKVFF